MGKRKIKKGQTIAIINSDITIFTTIYKVKKTTDKVGGWTPDWVVFDEPIKETKNARIKRRKTKDFGSY